MVALALLLVAGVAQASATEPVFDSAYNTRLGNILRGTLSTTSDDYLALEALAGSSRGGDRTASLILATLQRTRADIGDAPPLRKLPIPSGPMPYAYSTNAGTFFQVLNKSPIIPPGWGLSGRAANEYLCNVYAPDGINQMPEDFHQISGPYGCYMEALANYNDTDEIKWARQVVQSGLGGGSMQWDGCTHLIANYQYEASPCMAGVVLDRFLWELLSPVGNVEPLASQTYTVYVGYQWWDTSWNPLNAPTDQTTSLADGRARLDDADNTTLRQWLNHLFDPADYAAPLPVGQTKGDCDGTNNFAPTACVQVTR